jgi:AcrR family transcriptional regulator
MAATAAATKRLEGDKAQRIIEAMRTSVGTRGAAGSTFDVVAREAGVSRGLLHYYFGSKERLLVEVVRHDCEVRIASMGERIAAATTADEIMGALVLGLEEFIEGEPNSPAVIYELLSASRHSDDIRAELAELYRRWRADLADALRTKEREGVVRLEADPESVASMLFALGDGFGIQVLSDPDWDREAAFDLGVRIARRLLGADR